MTFPSSSELSPARSHGPVLSQASAPSSGPASVPGWWEAGTGSQATAGERLQGWWPHPGRVPQPLEPAVCHIQEE